MAILDELSGFEFEQVMVEVFRGLGYERVRQAARTADEGRDVLMEEVHEGTRRAIVVECKHTATVGRPVVQKLHSAVATYPYEGPTRGMVATTGRFTGPAEEYASRLRETADPNPVELLDGEDLRALADRVGLDLYNGRVEILCEELLHPATPTGAIEAPLEAAFATVEHMALADRPAPEQTLTLLPVVAVATTTDAVFETSVGVIHRISDRSQLLISADRSGPGLARRPVATLVAENLDATVTVGESSLEARIPRVERKRFGQTRSAYAEWVVDQLRAHHRTTVRYTGDNNVTYEKTCEPTPSDIAVERLEPRYLPVISQTVAVGEYSYEFAHVAAGDDIAILDDGIRRCAHCETAGEAGSYSFCPNCGAIACGTHSKTEALAGEPICTGCAVTTWALLRRRYFYDQADRERFQAELAAMGPWAKATENLRIATVSLVGLVAGIVVLLIAAGLL
jgi:restriction endonuclease Mrr